jgi:mannose-6-phosphate isomerase-like protein (cupin superfamily)
MTADTQRVGRARVLGPDDGEIKPGLGGIVNRFMIDGKDTHSGFSLVEHRMEPRCLAAPLHRHTREDEYSFVLDGRIGALLGDEELFGEAGDLIVKPRAQWHTFWNAGDEPARLLEIISPAGFEGLFHALAEIDGPPDPVALAQLAARYGAEVDFERTPPIIERHGLVF